MPVPESQDPPDPRPLDQTAELLARSDEAARGQLFERYGPRLRTFLHGRLPGPSRRLLETSDLTQDVWRKALSALDGFDARGTGSFWWFLRRIAVNHLADVYRRTGVRNPEDVVEEASAEHQPSPEPGPLASALGAEAIDAFDRALQCVGERERDAALMRLELDESWAAIATDGGWPTPDAARVAVQRALQKICKEMSQHAPEG